MAPHPMPSQAVIGELYHILLGELGPLQTCDEDPQRFLMIVAPTAQTLSRSLNLVLNSRTAALDACGATSARKRVSCWRVYAES